MLIFGKGESIISDNSDEKKETKLLNLNCDKANHQLGWHATWDIENTIKQTIFWYKGLLEEKNMTKYTTDNINSFMEDFI